MKHKKPIISFFACIALCGVGLIAQTHALKAMEQLESDSSALSGTGAVLPVAVIPAESATEIKNLRALEDLCESFPTQADFVQLTADIDIARALVVTSVLSERQHSLPIGMNMVQLIQLIENIKMYDDAKKPHVSDYFSVLPVDLGQLNTNIKHYQWLSKVVYVVQERLKNKLVTQDDLKAGYVSYLEKKKIEQWLNSTDGLAGEETYRKQRLNQSIREAFRRNLCEDAKLSSKESFSHILGLLAITEGQDNPFQIMSRESPYFLEMQGRLDADLSARTIIEGGGAINKGDLTFVVYNTEIEGDVWHALGTSEEEINHLLVDAVKDHRIFLPEYYVPLLYRLLAVHGETTFLQQSISSVFERFMNEYAKEGLELSECTRKSYEETAKMLTEFEEVRLEDEAEFKRNTAEHLVLKPQEIESSAELDGEQEKLAWGIQQEEALGNYQLELKKWSDVKTACEAAFENKKFVRMFSSVFVKRANKITEITDFVEQDFTRLNDNRSFQIDPAGNKEGMLYVEMFRRLANVNVYMWMIASDAYFSTKPRLHYVSSKQIALAGIWKVSETARDEHFLLIR
ncbi:MAG: hypothetical protein V4482_01035 [Pseudomonadota bacterium]